MTKHLRGRNSLLKRLKDYLSEVNNARRGWSIERVAAWLNRQLGCEAVEVVYGHRTLLRIRGVPRKVMVQLLTQVLAPHGSAVIWRRRGLAATWLLRPLANRPLIRL